MSRGDILNNSGGRQSGPKVRLFLRHFKASISSSRLMFVGLVQRCMCSLASHICTNDFRRSGQAVLVPCNNFEKYWDHLVGIEDSV